MTGSDQKQKPETERKVPAFLRSKKQRIVTVIVAAGLIGIFLLGIAPMFSKDQREQNDDIAMAADETDSAEYAENLEQKLESVLGQIEGVGRVEVMVTLRQGYSYRYAVTEKENKDRSEDVHSESERRTAEKSTTEQSYVLLDGKSGSEPLITATGEPEIRGVVIVCDGGGDPKVVSAVTDTIRVALDLSSARINVSRRSPGA